MKRKLLFLSTIAAVALCWQVVPASVDRANAGIGDYCSTQVAADGCCYVVCPQGDGVRLDDAMFCHAVITVTVINEYSGPIPGIPAADFWLIGCNNQLVLCGGSGAIDADSATNADGTTTISGALAAGGCDLGGLSLVIQGYVLDDPATYCTTRLCLPYPAVSPDINGDLIVDIVDFSLFGIAYGPPPDYDACLDYNCDGLLDIIDFSLFAQHYQHGW